MQRHAQNLFFGLTLSIAFAGAGATVMTAVQTMLPEASRMARGKIVKLPRVEIVGQRQQVVTLPRVEIVGQRDTAQPSQWQVAAR